MYRYLLLIFAVVSFVFSQSVSVIPQTTCSFQTYNCSFCLAINAGSFGSVTSCASVGYSPCNKNIVVNAVAGATEIPGFPVSLQIADPTTIPFTFTEVLTCTVNIILHGLNISNTYVSGTVSYSGFCSILGQQIPLIAGDFGKVTIGKVSNCAPLNSCSNCLVNSLCSWCPSSNTCLENDFNFRCQCPKGPATLCSSDKMGISFLLLILLIMLLV